MLWNFGHVSMHDKFLWNSPCKQSAECNWINLQRQSTSRIWVALPLICRSWYSGQVMRFRSRLTHASSLAIRSGGKLQPYADQMVVKAWLNIFSGPWRILGCEVVDSVKFWEAYAGAGNSIWSDWLRLRADLSWRWRHPNAQQLLWSMYLSAQPVRNLLPRNVLRPSSAGGMTWDNEIIKYWNRHGKYRVQHVALR